MSQAQGAARRRLSLWDCLGVGLNSVVGSGVYLLIAPMAAAAGAASVAGILACAALCALIALCFAELGAMHDQDGGSYVYARRAFGTAVGFGVGWISLVNIVLGYAAVAAGFGDAVGLRGPVHAGVLLVVALTAINWAGVKGGAWSSDVLSAVKVLPLVALAAGGVALIKASVAGAILGAPGGDPPRGYFSAVSSAAFIAVFMLSGFEYTAIPAGEARRPKRDIPLALVGSLLGAAVLYAALQLVALSVLPDLGHRDRPLVEVARQLAGSTGAAVIEIASVVSMAGFCAGSALVAPRALTALCEAGFLPSALARRSAGGEPRPAILLIGAATAVLAMGQGYTALVNVANVAVFAQYVPTCLAVIVLRRTAKDVPRPVRLPLGPAIPLVAAGASVVLLWAARPAASEWIQSALLLLLGGALWAATLAARRFQRAG
ncbi:MAG TPA: APC family permease [Myxococcales bacterium]|nr:APC family permease [Myxococcales bacterium]